jgi:hypothetical protein
MLAAQFGHCVIGDAGKIQPDIRRGDVLDRGVRQRDDLAIVAKLIHLLETRIEVEELGDSTQSLADVLEVRRDFGHFLKITVRKDMTVDVDNRAHGFPSIASDGAD